MPSAVGPVAQRTSDALVFTDRALMRAYQLQQTARSEELADELFAVHIWLAGTIEYLLGARSTKPKLARECAYLLASATDDGTASPRQPGRSRKA